MKLTNCEEESKIPKKKHHYNKIRNQSYGNKSTKGQKQRSKNNIALFFFRKDEIEGLKVMLRNRLDEIEIWKQRCYKLEGHRINNEDSI